MHAWFATHNWVATHGGPEVIEQQLKSLAEAIVSGGVCCGERFLCDLFVMSIAYGAYVWPQTIVQHGGN